MIDNHLDSIAFNHKESETKQQFINIEWDGPKNKLGEFFKAVYNTLPPERKSLLRNEINSLDPKSQMIFAPGEIIYDLAHQGRGYVDFPDGNGDYSHSYVIPLKINNLFSDGQKFKTEIGVDDLAEQVADLMSKFIANRGKNEVTETWEGQHKSLAKQSIALRMLGDEAKDISAILTFEQDSQGTYLLRNIESRTTSKAEPIL